MYLQKNTCERTVHEYIKPTPDIKDTLRKITDYCELEVNNEINKNKK